MASDLRSSRAQNRSFGGSVPPSFMDFFRVSPLQAAQKTVALRSSSIHAFGLVLVEPADTGELITEYVGELVRSSVANVRELRYERDYHGSGIASSYLFRLDDMMVIDATSRGNLARFINHSCDPNCIAKTMSLNGSKRIVMYAKRPIRSGEELTYDYKFPTEKDPKKKIRCLCGQSNCRRYLN
jgi:SET domain-containing protein